MPTKDTNNNGEATFDLAEGNYSVHVEEPGYRDGTDSFSIGANETITRTVTLQEADLASVTVTVTNGNTGSAISGASVSAAGESSTTDSSGTATLNIPGGTWELTANSGGFEENTTSFSVEYGESISLSIPLTPEAEPTLIDDFDRSSIDPWVNTHEEYQTDPSNHAVRIVNDSFAENGRAMEIVPASAAEVSAGLQNFPEAGGGPNSDGAWEAQMKFTQFGGTLEMIRIEWARSGGNFLRWQVQDSGISIRVGSNWQFSFNISQGVGDVRILRVNEHRTNGYIDCSVHDGTGRELDRISTTLDGGSSAPQSGGMRVWANYTTAARIGHMRLLD